jgi:hypothetical protein
LNRDHENGGTFFGDIIYVVWDANIHLRHGNEKVAEHGTGTCQCE